MDIYDIYDIKSDVEQEDLYYGDDYGAYDDDYETKDPYGYMDDFDGPVMEATFDQKVHSSHADECGGLPINVSSDKMDDLTKAINRLSIDPLDRFKRQVGAISHSLSNNESIPIDIDIESRNDMCRNANSFKNARFLNPTAYILGYYITNGEKNISKSKMKTVFSFLNKLRDDSVKKPDVVRYARFWKKHVI